MNPLKKLGLTKKDIMSVSPQPTSCEIHLTRGRDTIDLENVSYWKDYSEFDSFYIKGRKKREQSKFKCVRTLIEELPCN